MFPIIGNSRNKGVEGAGSRKTPALPQPVGVTTSELLEYSPAVAFPIPM